MYLRTFFHRILDHQFSFVRRKALHTSGSRPMQNNRVKKNWNPDAYARHTSFVWELTTILKKRSVKVLGITDAPGPE